MCIFNKLEFFAELVYFQIQCLFREDELSKKSFLNKSFRKNAKTEINLTKIIDFVRRYFSLQKIVPLYQKQTFIFEQFVIDDAAMMTLSK